MGAQPHAGRLFVASCISLVTTSMVFATRGAITGPMTEQFHLTNEQIGLVYGPAFWGFTIAIFICGLLVDLVGMRLVHVLSSLGYLAGLALVLLAPGPDIAPGIAVTNIFAHPGTVMLFAGFLVMGLSQGLVEGVINPLVATLYKDQKSKMLNVLHAWWPGGMIIGGLLCVALERVNAPWQLKLGMLAVPSLAALAMALSTAYPQTERVQSNVSNAEMGREVFRPLFLLLLFTMLLTASTELGPDQWFGKVMGDITGWKSDGILFLCYTAGLMFVLRYFFSGVVHRFSPFAVLTVCAVLAGVGLYWLGSLPLPETGAQASGATVAMAFVAATVFGVGKTYFWPTMLGITSEQFPRGGALLMNLMGGAGMLASAVILPIMGSKLDQGGPGAALQSVSALAIALVVIFGSLLLYFRARGGYKPVTLSAAKAGDPADGGRRSG
jgi:MFS family permease